MLPVRIVERGDSNIIVATEAGLRLRCLTQPESAWDDGAHVSVLVRPERVNVAGSGGAVAPGQNRIAGRIADVTYLGEDLHLSLDLASGDRLRASMKNANPARFFAPGQSVDIVIGAADLRLLRR